MIPWHDFDSQPACWGQGIPIGPHEEYLNFLQNGPSMAEFVFKSPMMELAHERQFVVTQQGGNSADFVQQHTQRIDTCLGVLDQNFHQFAGTRSLPPTAKPPAVDGVGLWTSAEPLEIPALLHIAASNHLANYPKLTQQTGSCLHVSSSQASDCVSPFTVSSRAIEDLEFSDEQEGDMVRSFIASECHRSGRYQGRGAHRAKKSIRQRRRLKPKVTQHTLVFDPGTTADPG